MAIVPSTDYSGQVDTDAAYPHGKAKNVTVAGDGTGTPLEKAWVNDLWGFLQNLLNLGGVTPSGNPDEVGTSDYWDALVLSLPIRFAAHVYCAANTPTVTTLWGPAPDTAVYNTVRIELGWTTSPFADYQTSALFVNNHVWGGVDKVALGAVDFDENITMSILDVSSATEIDPDGGLYRIAVLGLGTPV